MATGSVIDGRAARAAPGGRRPRVLLVVAVLVAAIAVVTAVGVGLAGRPPAAAAAGVCAADGSACTPLAVRAAAEPVWALLPLGSAGRLRVTGGSSSGDVGVGVVAYLATDGDGVRVLPRTTSTGGVLLAGDARRTLTLAGVPDGADLVLLRTDGVEPAPDVAPPCPTDASGACRDLRVSVRTLVATPRAAEVTALLRARAGLGAAAAREAGAAVSEELAARAGAPARVSAAVRPGDGRLTVDWVLTTGGEDVRSVRVTVRPEGADAPLRTHDAIAATGSTVLRDLDRSTRYIVDVAPVVRSGEERVVGAPVELAAVPDGSPAAPGATTPSAPEGWKPLLTEDFDRDAPLGTFADRYPAWSWYDGMTETSRETRRPKGQVGVWDSATTMRVSDGMLDCHLWTRGQQPQVCALTPTPDDAIWHGQRYGRYTVRFKADPVPGYKIAWLLWPDSNEWTEGEVDFPEASLDGTITGSTHRNDGDPADFAYYFDTGQRLGGWHTATIDWRPGRITYLLDGESWTTTDPAGLPRVPMRWTLQAETEIEDRAPDPEAEGHILIDWVAAWSLRD